MGRPKSTFTPQLSRQAQADLDALDHHGVIQKLRAIIAAADNPTSRVAGIMGVTSETIWRWAKSYEKEGVGGLYPKPKKAKPSKLNDDQKAQVLSWVDERRDPEGRDVHWTLERLQQAIIDSFGKRLGINTIWTWLRKEGRKLKVPRPKHYKADAKAQAAFKKTVLPGFQWVAPVLQAG
jgi:transposase